MAQFTHEEFVVAWQEASTIKELMVKFGCSEHTIQRHARNLRKEGVHLKSMRANPIRAKVDVGALNELIKQKAQQ